MRKETKFFFKLFAGSFLIILILSGFSMFFISAAVIGIILAYYIK